MGVEYACLLYLDAEEAPTFEEAQQIVADLLADTTLADVIVNVGAEGPGHGGGGLIGDFWWLAVEFSAARQHVWPKLEAEVPGLVRPRPVG